MSDWGGFSDADLQKLKTQNEGKGRPKLVKPIKRPSQAAERQRRPRKAPVHPKETKSQTDVQLQAMLSQPKSPTGSVLASTTDAAALHGETNVERKTKKAENETAVIEIIDDENVIHEKEKIKLEDVTRRQKEMEEKNRRKRALLSKAISERKKKASAESVKLVKIQAELTKLDQHLSFDVSILRDKIDEACYSYNQAKKHFENAEAAYIAAKMDFHKHTEHKEELTEHLYHVIQLNEERKATKLEELMDKLDLEEVEEEVKQEIVGEKATKTSPPPVEEGATKTAPSPVEKKLSEEQKIEEPEVKCKSNNENSIETKESKQTETTNDTIAES